MCDIVYEGQWHRCMWVSCGTGRLRRNWRILLHSEEKMRQAQQLGKAEKSGDRYWKESVSESVRNMMIWQCCIIKDGSYDFVVSWRSVKSSMGIGLRYVGKYPLFNISKCNKIFIIYEFFVIVYETVKNGTVNWSGNLLKKLVFLQITWFSPCWKIMFPILYITNLLFDYTWLTLVK